MDTDRLSLREALETSRLEDFIAQEEARGVEAVDERELMEALEATIKPAKSADRTSRSADPDGLPKK